MNTWATAEIPNTHILPIHNENMTHHIQASICMIQCLKFSSGICLRGLWLEFITPFHDLYTKFLIFNPFYGNYIASSTLINLAVQNTFLHLRRWTAIGSRFTEKNNITTTYTSWAATNKIGLTDKEITFWQYNSRNVPQSLVRKRFMWYIALIILSIKLTTISTSSHKKCRSP